ncbi:MAG: hypothetical protein MHPSP_003306, partial [Paramarteilia canceri]
MTNKSLKNEMEHEIYLEDPNQFINFAEKYVDTVKPCESFKFNEGFKLDKKSTQLQRITSSEIKRIRQKSQVEKLKNLAMPKNMSLLFETKQKLDRELQGN